MSIQRPLPAAFALLLLWPFFAAADLTWHEFGVGGEGDHSKVTAGKVAFVIETRDGAKADFKEDQLVMRVRVGGRKEITHGFYTSYGLGAIAVQGNMLFLKYGVGRGISVRTEHVKILRLDHDLEELADVQISYYRNSSDPKQVDPDLIEYGVKVETSRDWTTITFATAKAYPEIPSEKVVKVKNDR